MTEGFMDFRPKRVHFPRPGWNFHTIASVILLLLWLPFYLTGGSGGSLSDWYLILGLSREGLLEESQIWSLATYPLLHGNFVHWLTNAFFIFYFGGRLHSIFGEREVWRTAGWASLAGGLGHLIFQGNSPLVGASAIGMGFFVAVTTVSPESKMFPLPLRARNLRNGVILGSFIMLLMIPSLKVPIFSELGTIVVEQGGTSLLMIGHACHLGGALAGVLVMRKYFAKPITLAQLRKERAAREIDEDQAA